MIAQDPLLLKIKKIKAHGTKDAGYDLLVDE